MEAPDQNFYQVCYCLSPKAVAPGMEGIQSVSSFRARVRCISGQDHPPK